jgi:hypothetical protein
MNLDHNSKNLPVTEPIPVRLECNPPAAIAILTSGVHECCVIVDILRMPAPLARKPAPKPYRGDNSIMEAPRLPEMMHLSHARYLPAVNLTKEKAQAI